MMNTAKSKLELLARIGGTLLEHAAIAPLSADDAMDCTGYQFERRDVVNAMRSLATLGMLEHRFGRYYLTEA